MILTVTWIVINVSEDQINIEKSLSNKTTIVCKSYFMNGCFVLKFCILGEVIKEMGKSLPENKSELITIPHTVL
jgi:hypothetical protein